MTCKPDILQLVLTDLCWPQLTDKSLLLFSINTRAWSLFILLVVMLLKSFPYQSHVRMCYKDICQVNISLMLKTQQLLNASGWHLILQLMGKMETIMHSHPTCANYINELLLSWWFGCFTWSVWMKTNLSKYTQQICVHSVAYLLFRLSILLLK